MAAAFALATPNWKKPAFLPLRQGKRTKPAMDMLSVGQARPTCLRSEGCHCRAYQYTFALQFGTVVAMSQVRKLMQTNCNVRMAQVVQCLYIEFKYSIEVQEDLKAVHSKPPGPSTTSNQGREALTQGTQGTRSEGNRLATGQADLQRDRR